MATYKELIAHRFSVPEICKMIGADSLEFLSLEGMIRAIRGSENIELDSHCTACFSGKYPLEVPKWLFSEERGKMAFEEIRPEVARKP